MSVPSRHTCAPPSCRAGQPLVALHQAPDRALKHAVRSTVAAAPAQSVAEKPQRSDLGVDLGFHVQAFHDQLQPWQPQLATTACSTVDALEQSQEQFQLLLHRPQSQVQSIMPTQRRKQLPQQHQQRIAFQPRAQAQRARFRDALQRCQTWEQLAQYLMTEQQQQEQSQPRPQYILPPKQHQQQDSRICLWQQLSSQQARATLQHATQLASHQWRGQPQQGHNHSPPYIGATGSNARQHIDQELQTVLRDLVDTAAAGVVCGDAVAAAQVLRATWKLLSKPDISRLELHRDRELRQLQQQLLDNMCAATQPSFSNVAMIGAAETAQSDLVAAYAGSGRPPVLKNANLLADVSAAVVQLQLQPSSDWLKWYRDVSLNMMQVRPQQQGVHHSAAVHTRRQQEPCAVTSWFLVNAIQLAQYIHQQHSEQQQQQQQQQQDLFAAAADWQEAWCAAAAALDHPFSPTQLMLVATAAAQLRIQLLPSFLQAHLQPEGLTKFKPRELLRLLQILAKLQQQHHQQQQQWKVPRSWLVAAAEAVPIAAVELAEGDAAAARLLPGAVCAAARLKLPLIQAGLEQLLEALLAQPHHQQQDQQQGLQVTGANALAKVVFAAESDNPKPSVSTARSSSNRSKIQRRTSALRLVDATDACSAVVALAQISKHLRLQPPPVQLLQQLQQQLRPLLVTEDTSDLTAVLWAFRVVWKVPIIKPFIAVVVGVTQHRLRYCNANQLRLLIIALATAAPSPIDLPAAWTKQYLARTADILAAQQASFTSTMPLLQQMQAVQYLPRMHQHEQQQQQDVLTPAEAAAHAAFLANVACCLAKLQVTPGQRWRALWQQQVVSVLRLMTPDQVVDVLYAAAVWANQPDNAHTDVQVLTSQAQAAEQSDSSLTQQQALRGLIHPAGDMHADGVGSELVQDKTAAPVTVATATPVLQDDQHQHQQLLPKPVFRAVPAAAEAVAPQVAVFSSTTPPAGWVNAVLLQLRRQMPHCTPKQLTTVLWCLNKLRFRAAVPWLDALYDGLISQLPQCSLLQLQQLLRGLVHQGLQLAPARIDHVLGAALRRMYGGSSSARSRHCSSASSSGSLVGANVSSADTSRGYACTEQQLVWLLQLVVQLKHDPDPEWGRAVARVAQHMLAQHARSSGGISNAGWDAPLLTELLDSFALLGVQLPPKWMSCYRLAVWRAGLRSFSGLQLARVLSSLAALHYSTIARPFLQGILQQLVRQLQSMDPHALGLAGVAVGQLGLVPARLWSLRYLQRVQQLMQYKIRVAVSDAANLQRSVQYTRWCMARSSSRRGSKQALVVRQVAGQHRKWRTAYQRRHFRRFVVAWQA